MKGIFVVLTELTAQKPNDKKLAKAKRKALLILEDYEREIGLSRSCYRKREPHDEALSVMRELVLEKKKSLELDLFPGSHSLKLKKHSRKKS